MPKDREPSRPLRFAVGDQVRVKPGTKDPDFPDMPLGGWAGTVKEIEAGRSPTYLVEWNSQTLKDIHPVCRKRCEKEGMDIGSAWLGEDDLLPHDGRPVQIEQPSRIVTKPLSMDDQDDRLRAVLGLTSDDPVPSVGEEMLRRFYRHLSKRLTFPFEATYSQEAGPLQRTTHSVTILGLLDLEDSLDEDYGLFCWGRDKRGRAEFPLAEIEVTKANPNRQPVDDYSYWFWNWR